MTETAAILVTALLIGLTIFQLALISGAPLGKYAWGGAHTALPTNLRIGSVISIVLYGLIGAVLVSKAELFTVFTNKEVVSVATWAIAAYFTLGIVLNGISRSRHERYLMTPIVIILTVATVLIALN